MKTCCVRPVRNEVRHEKTLPDWPKETYNRCRRIAWSTVSKGADISRNLNNVTLPWSAAANMSEKTFKMAVLV